MQQHAVSNFSFPVFLMPRSFLAPLLVLPLLLVPAAALAAPATEAEMNLYTRIAAVNVCIARGAGVPFDKAVGIAGETIAQLIQGQHDGVISQVGAKPLSIDDLRKGSINSAVLGAAEICPKEVPADVMAKVQDAIKQSPDTKPAVKPATPKPATPQPATPKPATPKPNTTKEFPCRSCASPITVRRRICLSAPI